MILLKTGTALTTTRRNNAEETYPLLAQYSHLRTDHCRSPCGIVLLCRGAAGIKRFRPVDGSRIVCRRQHHRLFDGYLARIWKQTSTIGRMLDPIADKLLVSAILLLLAVDGTIAGWTLWAAIIILCREILVSGLREYLAELKVSVPVSRLAKWKTTAQMIALAFLLAGPAGDKIMPYVTEIGIVLLWASALLTLYTGWDYFKAGLKHVMD